MTRTIALLTDFGTTDTYVGVMKGVMLGICPDAQFVDLTHAIQPQNVRQAAFVLLNSYRYLPPGTIFLVVVDPGVGSERRALAVDAGDYKFVAPDNGVLSDVLRESGVWQAVQLENPAYRLRGLSSTFHGRDLFAPAAAHLAAGVPLSALGAPVEQPVRLPAAPLTAAGTTVRGVVEYCDHFGSFVTNVGLLSWDAAGRLRLSPRFADFPALSFAAAGVTVTVGDQTLSGIRRTYADVPQGAALALVGSSGYLELSVNGGSFAAHSDAQVGDPVVLELGEAG